MRIRSNNMFLSFLIVTILAPENTQSERTHDHQGPQTCGGRLKGPVGVIQTPNFPNPFPVPIKCRWIIESGIDNAAISIFFTQQFITSGLTFTEYIFYDESSYKTGERLALTVTEENITRINKLQVTSPVLIIELNLQRLEGTQLRALGLLNMYGFNITYTINDTGHAPDSHICSSAMECRLLGHCYASKDFKEFFCSCFEGYSGADCGVGHLCSQTSNVCKNGGTCGQVGQVAVSCTCAPGYTGELCEAEIRPECGIEECSEGCVEGIICDCTPKDSDASLARFDTQLTIIERPNLNTSQELVQQMKKYFKEMKIAVEDEINIISISKADNKGVSVVRLSVWAARREGRELRAALERLAAARAPGPLPPSALLFEVHPALNLYALKYTNQIPEVWDGSQFMLSCIAYGSPNIEFFWYKDGVKINFNGTTRDIWTRTVAEDALGRRMSVLGVTEARRLDSGKWSCAAVDGGRKRCRALRISVLKPPDIKLDPSSLTVQKGDNVSMTCLALVGRAYGALGFSWAKDKTLLRLTPGVAVWEDLYPAGSVLKLFNLQKSGEYRCQVSSIAKNAKRNAKSIMIWALGDNDTACSADASYGIWWPKTAPGAFATAACPAGHSGETKRFCESKTDVHEVKWMAPDFSGCVADSLKDIYDKFTLIAYGYSWENVSDILRQYGSVLRSLPSHPGQGVIPLNHCRDILNYLLSTADNNLDRTQSLDSLLKMYETLLKYPDSFIDEENIYDLQEAVVQSASMKNNINIKLNEFNVISKAIDGSNEAHMNFQAISLGFEEWIINSIGINLNDQTEISTVVAVLYYNLTERLPSLKRSIQFMHGREIEYLLASRQVQIFANSTIDTNMLTKVTLLFTHVKNYSAIASKLACGLRTSQESNVWNIKACEVRIPEPSHVTCICQGLGTYALFIVERSTLTEEEKDLRGVVKITAGLGGAMCLVAAVLQLLAMSPGNSKLPVILKVATAGSHAAAMLSLLECDTKQDEACPGVLGWICAACWCAGCAALCAQPLLLQAELAARTQRAASVGLVAGVSILAWLTARLWGGSPLNIGSAAQIVCTTGCVLLTMLCFALTICTKMRLRIEVERNHFHSHRHQIVHHTLVLLMTTSVIQITGVAYAQPGARQLFRVGAVSAAALANGLAMLICYVILDDEFLQGVRRIMSLSSPKDWHHPIVRDTSLNLYIKQNQEVESRGGVGILQCSSSPVSPVTSYWNARALGRPALHRRQSTPDSRADIVRCVEHRPSISCPRYDGRTMVCDLISHAPLEENEPRVCLDLPSLNYTSLDNYTPLLSYSIHYEPYTQDRINMSNDNCFICSQSNPDVSRIPSPPVKGCLKKPKSELSSSTSLPSIKVVKDEPKNKSDIEQVNREWTKAYSSPDSEKVLNKISNDLDFLLNRTKSNDTKLTEIEKSPL